MVTTIPNGNHIDGGAVDINCGINGVNNGIIHNASNDSRLPASKEIDQPSYESVAIIGCGMRLPGATDTDEALWRLLSNKQDGRCRVPPDRYNVDAFYGPGKAGHVCTEFGYAGNSSIETISLTGPPDISSNTSTLRTSIPLSGQ